MTVMVESDTLPSFVSGISPFVFVKPSHPSGIPLSYMYSTMLMYIVLGLVLQNEGT